MRSEHPPGSATRYLLVVGPPRSGTTLLASMIGRHPEVAMLIEDRGDAVVRLSSCGVAANKLCVPNQVQLTQKGNGLTRRLRRLGFFRRWPTARLSIEDYLRLTGARVVAIVRSGDDVVRSMRDRGRRRRAEAIRRWAEGIQTIHALHEQYPSRTLVISYERLVAEPEAVMSMVASFLTLDFSPAMLKGYRYNPFYPADAIVADRVGRGTANGVAVTLPARAVEQFQELVHVARPR